MATIGESSTLALTTVFQPPPSCLASTFVVGVDQIEIPSKTGLLAVTRGLASECYPSGFASLGTTLNGAANPVVDIVDYFSPGVCPDAYATQILTVSDGQTYATCCPN